MRESNINPQDYPQGPDGMAKLCADRLDELEGWKVEAATRAERSTINKKMHSLRMMLAWCKTRAGYTGALDG
jgi:hypothetical protein